MRQGRLDVKQIFTQELIIGFLRKVESGLPAVELCRRHGFSRASHYFWRNKFSGMYMSDAKQTTPVAHLKV